MLIVHEYPLHIMDAQQQVTLPEGALPLHVAMQRGTPFLWALIDTSREPVTRTFVLVRTGEPCPDGSWGHVGTALDAVIGLAWHVFMRQEGTVN